MSHPVVSNSPHPPGAAASPSARWGTRVQLGERRVLHPGRRRWLRALGWLAFLFFLTAAAFGLPLQAGADRLPPGKRTGRLWVPIGLHFAWNLAQGYLFGAVVSGGTLGGSIAVSTARPGAPAWLTGGAFGPEASVFALLVVGVVTLAALSVARKTGRFTSRSTMTDP